MLAININARVTARKRSNGRELKVSENHVSILAFILMYFSYFLLFTLDFSHNIPNTIGRKAIQPKRKLNSPPEGPSRIPAARININETNKETKPLILILFIGFSLFDSFFESTSNEILLDNFSRPGLLKLSVFK